MPRGRMSSGVSRKAQLAAPFAAVAQKNLVLRTSAAAYFLVRSIRRRFKRLNVNPRFGQAIIARHRYYAVALFRYPLPHNGFLTVRLLAAAI
jgi:hypothetical protein